MYRVYYNLNCFESWTILEVSFSNTVILPATAYVMSQLKELWQ